MIFWIRILFDYIELNLSPDEIIAKGFDESTVFRTVKMVNTNEYKRFQAPPYPENQFQSFRVRAANAFSCKVFLTFVHFLAEKNKINIAFTGEGK